MISQPTFLPWIGWFDLVEQADVMIIYDTAQFSRQSWQQRNRIRTSRGLEYLTVPVKTSGRFGQKIIDVEISNIDFDVYFKNKIRDAYSNAPYYQPIMDDLEQKLPQLLASRKLSHLNEGLIRFCCEWLGIGTKLIRASDLNLNGNRGEYLAKVCKYFDCNEYISTEGAEKYLLEDYKFFAQEKITVKIYKYEHPTYVQLFEPFIPYASIVDLLMMYGRKSKEVIQSTERHIQPIII
jgi:hypothetical protein